MVADRSEELGPQAVGRFAKAGADVGRGAAADAVGLRAAFAVGSTLLLGAAALVRAGRQGGR